jgi:hypothetical protein
MMSDGRGITNSRGCERPGQEAACARQISFVIPTPAVTFSKKLSRYNQLRADCAVGNESCPSSSYQPFLFLHRHTGIPFPLHERNTQGFNFLRHGSGMDRS